MSKPRTLHELTAYQLGRALQPLDLITLGKDRPLTSEERANLRRLRVRHASQARAGAVPRIHHKIPDGLSVTGAPNYRMGWETKTVKFYRRAAVRFERWARRAERLGLDKGHPPAHIREKALAIVNMTQEAAQ